MHNFNPLFKRIGSVKQWCQKIGSESVKNPIFEFVHPIPIPSG